ncbi:hypothetical protein [Photobacterium aquae]|nr:hypothetical protein [Photobacterium aquae]
MVWVVMPIVLSYWLQAAHFLRIGNGVGFWCSFLFPLLLVIKARWVPKVVMLGLVVISVNWVFVTYQILVERLMQGGDWLRMLLIMGFVICFTLMSMAMFYTNALTRRYCGMK